jgi:hypothetical protein
MMGFCLSLLRRRKKQKSCQERLQSTNFHFISSLKAEVGPLPFLFKLLLRLLNYGFTQYLSRCSSESAGIPTNIANLKKIFNSSNYGENYRDELLASISDLFSQNVRLYSCPYLDKKNKQTSITRTMPFSKESKHLFEFLIKNSYIMDIDD